MQTSVPVRPFRFGVELSSAPSARAWREMARRAEDLGVSTVSVPDHFGAQFGPLAALMAAADATTTLRIGALVLANDYRHPVVLAKEAATIDLLSDGRLELGMGAGWMRSDYDAAGLPYDPAATRIERLDEALTIVRGLLGGNAVTHHGRHYQVTELDGVPKPIQQPVPVLVGGGGRRVLTIAARRADIVSINFDLRRGTLESGFWENGSADATHVKLGWVRTAARDRREQPELNIDVFAQVTTNRRSTLEALAATFGTTPQVLAESPHALIGTVDEIAEVISERRERFGFSYVTFTHDVMEQLGPMVARLTGT